MAICCYSFTKCDNITSVSFPSSITEIEGSAFPVRGSHAGISVVPDNPAFTDVDGILYNKEKTALIRFPVAHPEMHFKILNGVNVIGSWAFRGCGGLASVAIPAGVTKIDNVAFCECTNLTLVTIPDGTEQMRSAPFGAAKALPQSRYPTVLQKSGNRPSEPVVPLLQLLYLVALKKILKKTFDLCKNLNSVKIYECDRFMGTSQRPTPKILSHMGIILPICHAIISAGRR